MTADAATPDQPTPAAADAAPAPDDLRAALEAIEAERDAALAERDAARTGHEQDRRALLDRLRAALIASEPLVPAELVRGDTVEELEASFAAARTAIDRVRAEAASTHLSGGAPGRAANAPATARDKIRAGLADGRVT